MEDPKACRARPGLWLAETGDKKKMNREAKCYGLLSGVGIYRDEKRKSLPTTSKDLSIMRRALTEGLKFDPDNIRILGEEGSV